MSSSALSSWITALITRKQARVQVIDRMDTIYQKRISYLDNYIDEFTKKYDELSRKYDELTVKYQ
ncbi:MAG: hypothetical protein QM751_12885 [Paludibacteraceae bacterium]